MKQRTRFRPSLELLDDRILPSLNVVFAGGTLTLSGTPTAGPANPQQLLLSMPSPGVVQVQDEGATTINYGKFAVSRDLHVNLTSDNTNVNFDVMGNTFTGNVYFTLGRGDTDLTTVNPVSLYSSVAGGTIAGAVSISGGSGQEIYNIGQLGSPFAATSEPIGLLGNLTVSAPGGVLNPPPAGATGGHLFIDPSSTVFGNVSATDVEAVDVGAIGFVGGTVRGSLTINASGASVGVDVEIYGRVGSNLSVTGTTAVGGGFGDFVGINGGASIGSNVTANFGDGVNWFELDSGGVIGGSLSVNMGNGPDVGPIFANEVDLVGTVGGSFTAVMGNGDSTLYFDPAAVVGGNFSYTGGNGINDLDGVNSVFAGTGFDGTVGGNLSVRLANGTDNMTFGGTVNGSTFSFTAGTGSNTLTINGNEGFALTVTLFGGGNNTVAFGATATVGKATIDFGTGVTGSKTWTPPSLITFPLTLRNFP